MNLPKISSSASALLAAALLALPAVARAQNQPSDSDIARDVRNNLPDNLRGHVSVSCNDGVVTLSGTVMSDSQKSWVESAAKQVPEVRSINDNLQVSNPPERSDKWIAFKIKSELLLHKDVSATHTDVAVNNGVVTLTGTADNSAQRDLTAQYAKQVEGVRAVHNQIQIRDEGTFAGDSGYANNNKTDDASITAKIKWQLAKNESTSAIHTSVHTQNGVVYIAGVAHNDAEKDLVTKIAKDTPGVSSVENDMTIGNP